MENNRNRQPNVKERTLINRIKRHFKRYGGISIVDFPHYEEVEKVIGWNKALDIAMEELKNNKLTKEELITELQNEYIKNGKITRDSFKYTRQVEKIFGSWNKALQESLGISKKIIFTKEELITMIQQQYYKDKKISAKAFKYAHQVMREFGSWSKGMEEALSFHNFERREYTREEVIEGIRKEYKENPNLKAKTTKFYRQSVKHFGSWNEALRISIGKTNKIKITKEEVIEAMKIEYEKNGEIYGERFKYYFHAIKHFGTWNNAMMEVFGFVNMKTHTKEELVKMIQDIHKKDGYITVKNFNHVNQVKKYFKSWGDALEYAIGKPNVHKLTKEEVIMKMREQYERDGVITYNTFKHMSAVEKYFGKWSIAMEEVLGIRSRVSYTKDELIEMMREQYNKDGEISKDAFKFAHQATIKFGSWTNALKIAIGIDRSYKIFTKEELINMLKDEYMKNGKVTSKTFKYNQQVKARFGSWSKAMEEIFNNI